MCASLSELPSAIRNVAFIGGISHGKTTLIDSLAASAGFIPPSAIGDTRCTATRRDERRQAMSFRTTPLSLCLTVPGSKESCNTSQGEEILVHILDTPGHLDFFKDTVGGLRLADGAIFVADALEGLCLGGGVHIQQARAESVQTVLLFNKLDRLLFDLQWKKEKIYKTMIKTLDDIKSIEPTASFDPLEETCAFGSGIQGWGFTLLRFAKIYAKKFGLPIREMLRYLWGDHYYDSIHKKWITNPSKEQLKGGKGGLERGFCKFVLGPLCRLFKATMYPKEKSHERLKKILHSMNVDLTEEEETTLLPSRGKLLLRLVLQKLFPMSDTLIRLIALKLPSPAQAQRQKVPPLFALFHPFILFHF